MGQIILFIDDPISSLDNNHIYAVYSEIDKLRNEEISTVNGKITKYKQIFISTHNYHLFSLLADRKYKYNAYYAQRNNKNSVIIDFPDKILRQKAEYSFLFYQIKKYIDNEDKDYYMIGHFLRRFLEIFISYKNPSSGNFRERLNDVVDMKPEFSKDQIVIDSIYKAINDDSHAYIANEVLNNGSILCCHCGVKFYKIGGSYSILFFRKEL